MMWKLLACCLLGCSLACSDEHSCADVACLGTPASIVLVDEGGAPVAARGEVQDLQGPSTLPFDCTLSSPNSSCHNNLVVLGGGTRSSYRLQIRFEQGDGSFTPWQRVDVEVTGHTDPDFDGPGCSCTWYDATAANATVPATARLPVGVAPDAG
jgi:hypothetical protein